MSDSIRLAEVVTLQRGTTYKSARLGEPGPVLLGLGTIQRNGGFRDDQLRSYGGKSPANLLLYSGDLFLSLKDVTQSADLLGAVAKVPASIAVGRLTQDTVRLDVQGCEVASDYLYWMLRTPQYRSYCRERATGTTNLGLSREDFLSYQIPRPTRDLMVLVELLGALDDKIASNDRLVRTSDELGGALTRSSLNPTEAVALSEIALITMGSSPPGTSYNEAGDGMVFYQGVRDFGLRYPRNRVWTTMPVRLAQKHDCLLSVRAPVGEVNLAGEATCIGRGLAAVRSTSNAPWSLFHLLKDSPQVWAPFEAEGTVFGSINKNQLASLRVPTVRVGRREALERQLESLETRIAVALKENDRLGAIRDELLPQLMSGKIRVKDVEETVEEVL